MARVYVGDDRIASTLIYGETQPSTMRFLERQYNEDDSAGGLSQAKFGSRMRDLYDRFHDSTLMARTRAAIRKLDTAFTPDDIRPLKTIGALQHAKNTMRRFIMASPEVRAMYQQQRIEGYGHHYVDDYADKDVKDIPEYQHVMSGLMDVNEDGDTEFELYLDVEYDLDEYYRLDIDQQLDIRATWLETIYRIRLGKEDPTSTVNAYL